MTVLALTVLGDGVRTALDPRAASRLRVGTGRRREKRAAAEAAGSGSAGEDVAGSGSAAEGAAREEGAA